MPELKWKDVLLAATILAGVSAFLIGHVGIRIGAPVFGSETGMFDAIVAMLTLIALVTGGVGAFVSYQTGLDSLEATRSKDRWDQFRAGVQMLAADTDSEAIAGIEIITQLTEVQVEPFERVGYHVLRSYVNELSEDAKAVVWDRNRPTTITETTAGWPSPETPEVTAFVALGSIISEMTTQNRSEGSLVDGRAIISNIMLVDRVIYSTPFRNIYVDRIALDRVTFRKCDFRGAKLVGKVRSATFEDCDLTNAQLDLQMPAFGGTPPKFVGCNLNGAQFMGEPLEDWIAKNT